MIDKLSKTAQSRKDQRGKILRDNFAMEAMKILIPIIYANKTIDDSKYVAQESYAIANKMMKEREEK